MKKYLLVAMTLGIVGASAESNPFALQKNLQKIDQDQAVLLSALQEMADNKDEFADTEDITTHEIDTKNVLVAKESVTLEDTLLSEGRRGVDTVRPVATRKVLMGKKTKMTKPSNEELMNRLRSETDVENTSKSDAMAQTGIEEERIRKVKEAQVKMEEARVEQGKVEAERAEAKRMKKEEEERREVAAYEAERLAKKIAADKLVEEEKKAAVAKEKAKKAEQLQRAEANEIEAKKHAIVDINITQEKMMAESEADRVYHEAVKEMD